MAEDLGMLRCTEVAHVDAIACHAFSRAEKLLAVGPGDERVIIFKCVADDFHRVATLARHTHRVTGLDWSCHDRLVSVAEDRAAFIWTWDADVGEFKGSAAELNAPRAALCVSWSPDGLRFAAGLASKEMSVCHYEEQVKCWISKKVGKAAESEGSVTCLAWHPGSGYIAAGGTDRRCIVYDAAHNGGDFGKAQLRENVDAWVNYITFSPNGNFLALVLQDSTVRFKHLLKGPAEPLEVLQWRGLPFLCATFLNEQCFVACGFDCKPVVFVQSERWAVAKTLEANNPRAFPSEKRESYVQSRAEMYGNTVAASRSPIAGHRNPISCCSWLERTRFATSSSDGLLITWGIVS
mmetsp:Transcript_22592/g.52653  ORF Transcript_22592/g.52653 Transcript_22592/m.52653 type:complete len:351 (-) Transcript_22592:138-1190(-)|eukprot:CAMPEP_0178405028 /NCGR_PEP_ID=MMETSP0689_2-20121128/18190_1 /TAXON_ID=160604 /ORGANISM="Amphidinium massartii, Strain CS-259" /LENGTH=350 /DNA_ID=CAMNT_0020026035 /DNA_START=101 /DNA_END=1153 /DNA_ORIENTATION=-